MKLLLTKPYAIKSGSDFTLYATNSISAIYVRRSIIISSEIRHAIIDNCIVISSNIINSTLINCEVIRSTINNSMLMSQFDSFFPHVAEIYGNNDTYISPDIRLYIDYMYGITDPNIDINISKPVNGLYYWKLYLRTIDFNLAFSDRKTDTSEQKFIDYLHKKTAFNNINIERIHKCIVDNSGYTPSYDVNLCETRDTVEYGPSLYIQNMNS